MTLTYGQVWEIAKKFYEEHEYDYGEYSKMGIRFEDKQREIGDICECSKSNANREDARDFPKYGTEEYNELEELDGTSAWDLSQSRIYDFDSNKANKSASSQFSAKHCYIVIGRYESSDIAEDEGEIIIENAKVAVQIF